MRRECYEIVRAIGPAPVAGALLAALSVGCAQLAGIEPTTGRDAGSDAAYDAARDAPVDAAVCAAGDARVVDPQNGTCYTFFLAAKTRVDARAACAAFGNPTQLASIQTANENALVATLVGDQLALLGGSDELTEGTFRWDDGTDVVYTNWIVDEPNSGQGNHEEDCIIMNGAMGAKWDDRPCAPGPALVPGVYPFVCERY